MSAKENTKFHEQLSDYPHTFQLGLKDSLSDCQQQKILCGLETALAVGYETNLETARGRNFLAYLYHIRHNDYAALNELDKVLALQGQQDNLVTLANKACILHDSLQLTAADEVVKTLQGLKEDETRFMELVVMANAEMAFTYTRLGPRKGQLAIALFNDAISKAKDPEVLWLWMFGLALTRRRALRADPQLQSLTQRSDINSEEKDLLKLLLNIAQNATRNNLKAKAYAELGTLLNMVRRRRSGKEFSKMAGMSPEDACRKALELDDNDNSVLCKCGRIFRYVTKPDESCSLLEKALSVRPSSTGFHHLGLTYKFLATADKYKDKVKNPGYYKQRERQSLRATTRTSYQDAARQHGRPISDRLDSFQRGSGRHASNEPTDIAGWFPSPPVPASASIERELNTAPLTTGLSLKRDIRNIQRVMKCPNNEVTSFIRHDKFIDKALHNLELAVDCSKGMNTRALYDLAILQKSLGEAEEAKQHLLKMLKVECRQNLFESDIINVYEQLGLIMREMAEAENDAVKKKTLLQDGNAMLLMALKMSSEILSKSPELRERIGEIWYSFGELWKEVEMSSSSPHIKLKNKAKLLQLIRDHKQSIDLLKEIDDMDPAQTGDLEYLKLCIEGYVEVNQYEKALTFAELLRCTAETQKIMALFSDKQYLLKVYLKAARQALMDDSHNAKDHFRTVFKETVSSACDATSGSEDTEATSEDGSHWDIMIVHEDEEEDKGKAATLSRILTDFCGLCVATYEDVAAGRLDGESVLRLMRRSSMVVVLAGTKPKVSALLRLYIQNAAKRPSTVTLLSGGQHVPEMLRGTHRSMECPPQVLHVTNELLGYPESFSDTTAIKDGICKIFDFIVNLNTTD